MKKKFIIPTHARTEKEMFEAWEELSTTVKSKWSGFDSDRKIQEDTLKRIGKKRSDYK